MERANGIHYWQLFFTRTVRHRASEFAVTLFFLLMAQNNHPPTGTHYKASFTAEQMIARARQNASSSISSYKKVSTLVAPSYKKCIPYCKKCTPYYKSVAPMPKSAPLVGNGDTKHLYPLAIRSTNACGSSCHPLVIIRLSNIANYNVEHPTSMP